jgi:hypothetical protein
MREESEALVLCDSLPKSAFFADLGRAGEGLVFCLGILSLLYHVT